MVPDHVECLKKKFLVENTLQLFTGCILWEYRVSCRMPWAALLKRVILKSPGPCYNCNVIPKFP